MTLSFSLSTILWIVAAALIVLWLLGLFTRPMRGFIHIVLLVAVLIILYNIFIK